MPRIKMRPDYYYLVRLCATGYLGHYIGGLNIRASDLGLQVELDFNGILP
jgi:hypothetical protein